MPFKALNKKDLTLLTKRRSQSALEYMMTYGWAILIIVIVAVILYSMGIFNPSSSISTTITGFSSTPVSSAIFTNNGGLSLSVQNSVGYPIEITNITATTTTGGKVTIQPNITLLPGKSQVLVLSKLFTAANQASHISTAVTITYKEISQPLPGPYISTGSITGSTPTVIYPANYTFAAVSKLTITNTQSSATPDPFQQMVNITSADNGWQLISNGNFGQNVEFFYSNGTVIPSWLESYTGSSAIWWLKLGSIPASSSITVYMGIAPTSTNLFNTVNDGEAPQLTCPNPSDTASCSTYAEYDDGANVFNYYTNFAGTSLPSGWVYISQGGSSYSLDNGITFYTVNNNPSGGIYSSVSISSPTVIDSLQSIGSIYTEQTIGPELDNFATAFGNEGVVPEHGIGDVSTSTPGFITGWVTQTTSNPPTVNTNYVNTFYYVSGNLAYLVNYKSVLTATNTFSGSNSLAIWTYATGAYTAFTQWLRIRAYPPNGVMPSVSFGSIA